MSKWVWSDLYWSAWILIGFLVPELLGYFRIAPWVTFSETVWHNISYPGVGPAVFATLIFLGVHFLYHRPCFQSIAYGLVVAGVAHWLDHRL